MLNYSSPATEGQNPEVQRPLSNRDKIKVAAVVVFATAIVILVLIGVLGSLTHTGHD